MLRSEALNQKYGLGQQRAVPHGTIAAAYRALMLRSEALNQKYGLGEQRAVPHGTIAAAYRALMLRSEALNQKYGLGQQRAVPQGTIAAASRALMLRSEALNQKYGLGQQKAAAVTSQPTNSTRGFAWGAFVIGAAVMFGLALLAGGFFVRYWLLATRRRLTPPALT
jgi:mannitol/fructose-specific phosphotransferase system IIA component